MCGLLWLEGKQGRCVVKPIIKRYRKQAERGKEGFGYVTIDAKGYIENVGRSTDEAGIIKLLKDETSSTILLHHRTPTSTPNYIGATHPLVVKDDRFQYDYYVIHNGVISSAKWLFDEYKKDGFKFLTEIAVGEAYKFVHSDEQYITKEETKFNDSESFAIDLAHVLEGQQDLLRSSGSIAFIALQCTKDGKVVNVLWGRNAGNPLKIEEDKSLFCLNSDVGGKMIDTGMIFSKNWDTKEITSKTVSGFTYGYSGARMGYDKKKEPITSEASDEIDDVLKNFVPRNVPVRMLPEQERERTLDYDSQQEIMPYGDSYWKRNKSGIITPLTDTIELEDLGYSYEYLDNWIVIADSDGSGDGGVIRQLRDDLLESIDNENDALSELGAAKDLLREALKAEPYQKEQAEEARAMIDVAMETVDRHKKQRLATFAEIQAYVPLAAKR